MIQLLIATLLTALLMFIVHEGSNGRFKKSVYSFEKYGMTFKVIRSYGSFNVVRTTMFKTTKIEYIFFVDSYSYQDLKDKAIRSVEDYYPWQREEEELRQAEHED